MEQFIYSVALMLIPILITYFNKKKKNHVHKSILEEGHKKVAFINSYFETLSKLSSSAEIALIKPKLSQELDKIKKEVEALDEEFIKSVKEINLFQKLFLTFKPLSLLGWLWAILFFVMLIFNFFLVLGFFLDDTGSFSNTTLQANLQDQDLILGTVIIFIFTLLIRWIGIVTFRKDSRQTNPAS